MRKRILLKADKSIVGKNRSRRYKKKDITGIKQVRFTERTKQTNRAKIGGTGVMPEMLFFKTAMMV